VEYHRHRQNETGDLNLKVELLFGCLCGRLVQLGLFYCSCSRPAQELRPYHIKCESMVGLTFGRSKRGAIVRLISWNQLQHPVMCCLLCHLGKHVMPL